MQSIQFDSKITNKSRSGELKYVKSHHSRVLNKKNPKIFANSKKLRNFAAEISHQLPCGVMVARRILVPPVGVRIPPRQQSIKSII